MKRWIRKGKDIKINCLWLTTLCQKILDLVGVSSFVSSITPAILFPPRTVSTHASSGRFPICSSMRTGVAQVSFPLSVLIKESVANCYSSYATLSSLLYSILSCRVQWAMGTSKPLFSTAPIRQPPLNLLINTVLIGFNVQFVHLRHVFIPDCVKLLRFRHDGHG